MILAEKFMIKIGEGRKAEELSTNQTVNLLKEYDQFSREERMKEFIKDSFKKPSWVWNNWNIGWFEFIQDFDKISLGATFDSAIHEPKNWVLFSIDFLFWNMTIQFGK